MNRIKWDVPKQRKVRVIIDTDTACEADDHYAIVHALLSNKCEVKGILATHFNENRGEMEDCYDEIIKILELMHLDTNLAYKGANIALKDENDSIVSDAVSFIINECLKDDNRPLYILCQGALTNVASALVIAPEIADKAVCITVGGCYEQGFEFNYHNDYHAANILMKSNMKVWQVPEEVYSTIQVSLFELYDKVTCYGDLGQYLFENIFKAQERLISIVPSLPQEQSYVNALAFPNGESWCLGDSAAIGILLSFNSGDFEEICAPIVDFIGRCTPSTDRKIIRRYKSINSRFILEDFFAKMKYLNQ